MKKLNLHDVYTLSQRLAPLREMEPETKYSEVAFPLWMARQALFEAVSDSSPLLDVAKRAGRSLIAAISAVLPVDQEKAFATAEKDKEAGYGIYSIKSRHREFETVLQNEMPSVPAYIVSKKGIYGTDDLIERADNYFPESLRVMIPIQARKDFSEAGKCLAFEVPTACAFHLWRAVEETMEAYYQVLTGDSADNLKNRNWGGTIKALRDAGAEETVTKFLDHIREEYRNPQMHPEEMVQLDEALALFGAAGSAINRIAMAMQKASDKKTPLLPGMSGSFADLIATPDEPAANSLDAPDTGGVAGEVDAPARPAASDDVPF